jgi:NADPH:quinone reductase-like Zn-dependent oxidoreductase
LLWAIHQIQDKILLGNAKTVQNINPLTSTTMTTTPSTNLAAVLEQVDTPLVLRDRPIPTPGPNHAIAINPAEWKRQSWGLYVSAYPTVLGSDVAGTVAAVGSNVTLFKPGDRVTGFGVNIRTSNPDDGALQTYTIVEAISAAKIPESLGFNEAATLPMAVATSGIAIFSFMGIELPSLPLSSGANPKSAIFLVWGGASSIGSVAIQMAASLGFVVFTTASEVHHKYLRSFGAAECFDYHNPNIVASIIAAAERYVDAQSVAASITHAFDAISENGTAVLTASVLTACNPTSGTKGTLVTALPWPADVQLPENVTTDQTMAHSISAENSEVGAWLFNEWLPAALESGTFKPSPKAQVVPGGLKSAQKAIDMVKKGISGRKLVLEVA